MCILSVRVKINKCSFEPFCFLILEDFSGSYCLLSFECMYVSLVNDSSDVCLGLYGLVGGWFPLFGLLNCSKAILFIYEHI